jgi:hypothetical protein
MKIEFYGHSDDCIEIRRDGKNFEEIGGYIPGDGCYSKALEVRSIGGARGVRIHVIWDGCWSFAVGQLEEDRGLPGWSFRVELEHGYSTRLVIETGEEMVEVTSENGKPLHGDDE